MSPLAKMLSETSVTNRKWWRETGYDKMLAPFPHEVKCFEVSQVYDLAKELAEQAKAKGNIAEALAFLPAPVTWIEHRASDTEGRPVIYGYLLVQKNECAASAVSVLGISAGGGVGYAPMPLADLPLLGSADADGWAIDSTIVEQGLHGKRFGTMRVDATKVDWDEALALEQDRAWWLYCVLSMINSPRIVDRSEHKASAGLQKFLVRKGGAPYQLLPWHEVFLDITPPPEAEMEPGTRLTGPRALHFCRQHLRFTHGRLVMVRAHYRGSAEVGIARTRYRVGTA